MTYKAVASPFAIAVAVLAFSPAAFAQTMIGDQELSQGSLPAVTTHCEMLAGTGTNTQAIPNAGNLDAANQTPGLATSEGTDVSAGTPEAEGASGNPDAENQIPQDETAVPADNSAVAEVVPNSGNADAEDQAIDGINLQAITLADCQAAGLVD